MGAATKAPSSKSPRGSRSGLAAHRNGRPASSLLAPLALLVMLGTACSSSTAPGALITFDVDLQGWSEGTTSDGWGTVMWVKHSGSMVKLDGVGGPWQPNA